MNSIKLLSTAALMMLVGCATNAVQKDYGRSFHQMIANQSVALPITAAPGVVQGANPDMLNAAIKEIQTDVSKGKDVRGNGNASSGASSNTSTPTQ